MQVGFLKFLLVYSVYSWDGHKKEFTDNWTPYIEGMMGYGMAKAAVHQLVKSLASKNSGLPKNSSALAILP